MAHPPQLRVQMRSQAFKKALLDATRDLERKELHFTLLIFFSSCRGLRRWVAGPGATGLSSAASVGQHKGSSGKGKPGKGKKGKGGRQYQATYLPGTKLEPLTHTPDS